MNDTLAIVKMATWISSTLRWPNRSASWAMYGLSTAYPIDPAPATVPARPYRPVIDAISSTVPSPYMDIDIRPTKPLAVNASAPGVRSRLR